VSRVVKFIEVDPEDVPNVRESRRGRVSYPILKSFMETGKPLVQLDRTGMQQGLQALTSSLGAYIRNHEMPIKLFQRNGQLYLLRLDLNDDGTPNPDWNRKPDDGADAPFVDEDEVDARFEQEKDLTTK
jgi:hypothetical protein